MGFFRLIDTDTLRRNLAVLARDFFTSLGWLYTCPLSEIYALMQIHEEMREERE